MIRPLHPFEVPLCIDGGNEFFSEAKLPGVFNPPHFCKTWSSLITSGMGVILGCFDGTTIQAALGALISPDMNTGDLVAIEGFWFVLHSARPNNRGNAIKLLFEFEKWAKSRGAKRAAMIHLTSINDERLEKIYIRMGYVCVEKHYLKDL